VSDRPASPLDGTFDGVRGQSRGRLVSLLAGPVGRRHFDYLRAIDGTAETVKGVKAWILDEYRKVEAAA
jgi:hypothetical protein